MCCYDIISCQSWIMIYDRFHIQGHRTNYWINEMYMICNVIWCVALFIEWCIVNCTLNRLCIKCQDNQKSEILNMFILIKIQRDATVCSLIYFTAKSLYMFWVSTTPIIRSTKTVTVASGTGHNIGKATSLQRGQIRSRPGHVGGK
jgi:hypothetical protein